MKLHLSLAKSAILNKNGLNHLQAEIVPPKTKKKKEEKPALMVFVLDRSGSMRDNLQARSPSSLERADKMTQAINAVTKFLTLVTPSDMVGIVSFNDISTIDQSLTHITDQNRNEVIHNIRRIQPCGCTNISDALNTAKEMISADYRAKYNCKIVLLSDGQANRGISHADGLSSLAQACLQEGITVTSLGVGYGYDSAIMGGIANSGGGLFYHIEDLAQLESIFKEELSLSGLVVAKNLRLVLDIPLLIEISPNFNQFPQKVENGKIEILIGDLYSPRKILFEIRNNFVDEDFVFNASVEYISLSDKAGKTEASVVCAVVNTEEDLKKAEENKEVIDLALSMIKDSAIALASGLYEQGRHAVVDSAFNDAKDSLTNIGATYCSADILKTSADMYSVSSAYKNRTADVSYTKTVYEQSNRSRREK